MRQAAKPATPEHTFGHGLRLYFWTFIVAILIFGLGGGLALLEGIDKILHPYPLRDASVNYIVPRIGMQLLALTASLLAKKKQSLQTGEGVQPEVRASIGRLAEAEGCVVGVNELLTMHFGPRDVLVALSLDFEDAQLASCVQDTVGRLEAADQVSTP